MNVNISLDPHDRWSTPPRLRRLWMGILLPAAGWVAHLGIMYPLAASACSPSTIWVFFVVSAAALAMALGGGWIARGVRERTADEPEDAPGSRARGRFMALSGLLLSALFSTAIVAQTIPMFLLEPCRY